MNDLATQKPITFGGDSKSARFRIDFFGQIYGKRQILIPMPRTDAIAFADKRCDHSYKKLKVPGHPRVADDLIRGSADDESRETRILYSLKHRTPLGERPVAHLDPSGWIPLSGDPESGWFGLVIPGEYACLIHGPSYAAQVFSD